MMEHTTLHAEPRLRMPVIEKKSISFIDTLRAYNQLTKPRIVLLFTLTGLATMLVEGSLLANMQSFWMIVLGIALTAASANAFNQYIDRDIDAVMERTSKKRPLPQGRLSPEQALAFAWVTGIVATAILFFVGNLLTAALGVATILFYIFIYTLWLKRSTPYNIVIGGAAGATAPLIGWAAGTSHLSLLAWSLFVVIFAWTPPHFWALALCVKDEYAKASVPMLPVVAGEEKTRQQILLYTIILMPFTFAPSFLGYTGKIYLFSALLLGGGFVYRAWLVYSVKTREVYWKLFMYSIVYLLALFVMLMIDALVGK